MSAIGAIRRSAVRTANALPKGMSPSVKYTRFDSRSLLDHSNVHVRLTGLPRTTTPADITRLLANNKVHNITKGDYSMCHRAPSSDLDNVSQLRSTIVDSSPQDVPSSPCPSRPYSQRR
jgi:hypothetical protein